MATLGIIMGYIMVFLLFGAVFIYIKVSPEVALPIAAILSLATALPSLFYYKSSVNVYNYIYILISGPFIAIFWSLVKNISKKAIIFKTNSIIALYITIFLPALALIINSYNYFTTDTGISSIIKYILLSIIGLTLGFLLILFIYL